LQKKLFYKKWFQQPDDLSSNSPCVFQSNNPDCIN